MIHAPKPARREQRPAPNRPRSTIASTWNLRRHRTEGQVLSAAGQIIDRPLGGNDKNSGIFCQCIVSSLSSIRVSNCSTWRGRPPSSTAPIMFWHRAASLLLRRRHRLRGRRTGHEQQRRRRSLASARRALASKQVDTLLIAGAQREHLLRAVADPGLRTWLPRLAAKAPRFGSVCSGAFILAGLGLLDGRRVTTHWDACGPLANAFPSVKVDSDALYVVDGTGSGPPPA